MTVTELPRALTRYRDEIAREMLAILGERDLDLYGMMRYHLGWSDDGVPAAEIAGKFLRGSLCLAANSAVGGDRRAAIPVAAGIELLHNFSLIHDDIQDGSAQRRNRDSVWRVWGEAQAINAGDGMFAMARLSIHRASDRGVSADVLLRLMKVVDGASLELSEGQYEDIAFEQRASVTLEEYLAMAVRKTGAVVGAAAATGALTADAPRQAVDAFQAFGRKLGLALQIRDDFLGVWGDPAKTGKSVEDDIRRRKKSYPFVHALADADGAAAGVLRSILDQREIAASEVSEVIKLLETAGAREATQSAAETLAAEALAELAPLNLAGAPLEDLSSIATFVVERDV